jgi:hypothetical protein
VGDIGLHVAPGSHGVHELTEQAPHRVDIQRDRSLLGGRQQRGQAYAGDVIGKNEERAARGVNVDGPGMSERFAAERGETARPLANGGFNRSIRLNTSSRSPRAPRICRRSPNPSVKSGWA